MRKIWIVSCLMTAIALLLPAQTQLGADIDAEAAGDYAGWAVSMPNALTVAIGAPQNNANGMQDAGQVRVYAWNGSAWLQKGADIDGQALNYRTGCTVSMPDDRTVAIGEFYNGTNGFSSGSTRIFRWDGAAWVQKGTDLNGEALHDESGYSVSMPDSNTVAIGAHLNDGSGPDAGHVRIYAWSGSAWVQKGADIDGESAYDESGYSVSMPDANTVAIGGPQNDANGSNAGHVRVYVWNGSAWVQKGADVNGAASPDFFGFTVSMPDANTLAVGAPVSYTPAPGTGYVQIYTWNGSAWQQKGTNLVGYSAGEQLGGSVSMPDPDHIAAGARYAPNGNGPGEVRIFAWTGAAWIQVGSTLVGEAVGDQFGFAVSMPDAITFAAGAILNDGTGSDAGHVRVYGLCAATRDTISPITCGAYLSPSGHHIWTVSNTYQDTIPNIAGCDSIVTIMLTVQTVDTSVTLSSPTVTAHATTGTFQWIDCDHGHVPIPGATANAYTATANGSYAVIVTQNGCVDTSSCVFVIAIGMPKAALPKVEIYPNPTLGTFTINLGMSVDEVTVEIHDMLGNRVGMERYRDVALLPLHIDQPAGVYFITLRNGGTVLSRLKILKE